MIKRSRLAEDEQYFTTVSASEPSSASSRSSPASQQTASPEKDLAVGALSDLYGGEGFVQTASFVGPV